MLVAGDGLHYEPFGIPAVDSQLIEQLRFTVEDVARTFHVPLYKLGGQPTTTFTNAHVLNGDYYSQTLQNHIEAIESLLDEGLALPSGYASEMDLDGLLRMDAVARSDAYAKSVGAGYLSPNEARARENLPPVPGGESPYLQMHNYSLAALAERPPPTTAGPQKLGLVTWKQHASDGTTTEFSRRTYPSAGRESA
jgi:phage portal protein BeeE